MERWVPALSALAGRSSSRDPNVDPGTRSDPLILTNIRFGSASLVSRPGIKIFSSDRHNDI